MTTKPKGARPGPERHGGPGTTLLGLLAGLIVLIVFGCGTATGECVAQYEFEGEVRKAGYTRVECEEECAVIGRALSCVFVGRNQKRFTRS